MQQEQASEPPNTVSLDILRSDGPAALDTHDFPSLGAVRLRLIQTTSLDEWNTKTTRSADDVFAALGEEEAIPLAGELTLGELAIIQNNSDIPVIVRLIPPNTIEFDERADRATIRAFLAKRRFEIQKATVAIILLLSLALGAAATPDPLVDDDDPDDDHTLRPSASQALSPTLALALWPPTSSSSTPEPAASKPSLQSKPSATPSLPSPPAR